jgi:hypothetical protein
MFPVTTMTRLPNNRSTSFLNKLYPWPKSGAKFRISYDQSTQNRVNKKFVRINHLQNMKIHIVSLNTKDEKENKL